MNLSLIIFLSTSLVPNVAIPKTNPSSWITIDDYPTKLLTENTDGVIDFRLSVGPNGKPVDCVVISGDELNGLGAYTCTVLIKKALFHPWNKTHQNNGPRYYRSKVFWKKPRAGTPTI